MTRVRERREAAAGDAGDDVDFVEQPAVRAVHDGLRAPQLFEHAVGKRRRPRAAAREGEQEQRARVVVLELLHLQGDAVARGRVGLRDPLVDGPAGATGERYGSEQPEDRAGDTRHSHEHWI